MTRFLQPPDLSINKQFKTYMYHNDWKIQNEYKLKSTGNNIIDWVVQVWNDEKLITKDMIIK